MSEEKLPLPRGPRSRIDWRYAAMLLAEGHSTIEVATILGCSRQHVWRMLRGSRALRARTSEMRRRKAAETAARLERLGEMAVDLIHQAVADGNKQVACWLADRLRLFDAMPTESLAAIASEGADQLGSEAILEATDEPSPEALATARACVEAADADIAEAARTLATIQSVQGDNPATVARSNALSALHYAATKSRPLPPPPGVFADD